MKSRTIFILILALTLFSVKTEAQSFMGDKGYVEFLSRAPMLEFKGISNNLVGLIDLDENVVDFYVDLNTLDTGIRLRNRHMRESYLETNKFPFAEFTGKLNGEVNIGSREAQQVSVTGKFNIHGVQRDITVGGTLLFDDNQVTLSATWEVKLEDYNIDRPRVIFYELSDTQVVTININLRKQ